MVETDLHVPCTIPSTTSRHSFPTDLTTQGLAPTLALDGMGGTYILKDARRRPVAVFKPRDEEPFAPNNPRGLAGMLTWRNPHTCTFEHNPARRF